MNQTRDVRPAGPLGWLLNLLAVPGFLAVGAALAYLSIQVFLLLIEGSRIPTLSGDEFQLFWEALRGSGIGLGLLLGSFLIYLLFRTVRVKVCPNSPAGFIARLDGYIADIGLLGLFLLFGVSALNILVNLIVFCVGLARAASIPENGFNPEPGRVREDVLALLLAVVLCAVVTFIWWLYVRIRTKVLSREVDSAFETFVSKRYLLAREGGRLVLLISTVSILGVAVGVMALVVVQSVMAGAEKSLKDKFMGIYAHIEFTVRNDMPIDPNIPRPVFEQMIQEIESFDFVKAAGPVMTYDTVIQSQSGSGDEKFGVQLRGVDPDREKDITGFYDYTTRGNGAPEDREVVIGTTLAARLNATIGDKVIAIGRIVPTANRTRPKTASLKIVGIFDSGISEVNERFVITNLKTVQDLTLAGDTASSIQITVKDPDNVMELGLKLLDVLPDQVAFITWQMRNKPFFQALQVERLSMFIILNLIVLVAALNIIGTLVMTVVQKTRDIGILKSMGAPSHAILRIFLLHGFLIGMVGTSLGAVWGLRLCWFVREDIEKIFELPPDVYGLDKLPVLINPSEIFIMVGVAMVICIAASIIPAWQAARLNPVEALRYD